MILDASAAVDLVLRLEPMASWVDDQLEGAEILRAPHVIDVEVVGAVRRFVLRGEIGAEQGEFAIRDFSSIRITRYLHKPLLTRVWELRNNVAATDGVYVALAEVLRAPLVTTDVALARAPGLEIEVRAFA